MERTKLDQLQDRIWITERCHMRAEKRNRFLEYYFHVTLALYALSSIFIALFQSEPNIAGFENVLTFTSICVLSISLLIFGFKFGETAAQHRSCYLDLQKLRIGNLASDNLLNEQYINILSYYPNHSSMDYMNVAISNIFFEDQNLKESKGNPIRFSGVSRLSFITSWAAIRILAVAFAFSPVLLSLLSIDAFSCSS